MDVTQTANAAGAITERATAARSTGPVVGFVMCLLGTVGAVLLFPDEPSPQGALVVPALVLTSAILVVPVMRGLTGAATRMNAENFVAFGYVFWLLLDLIQGAYDLRDASDDALLLAMVAVGVSSAAMWLGLMGRPWRLPAGLMTMALTPLDDRTVSRLLNVCFAIGMLNFAYAVGFDIPLMFSYLGESRWNVPWARAQLGGWSSFIDQLPYFGYVLPSLTALLLVRRGLTPKTVLAIGMSTVMLLFLAQSGGRRIIGVTCGAAIIVWIQSQSHLNIRKVLGVAVALLGLLAAMQFMLNIRTFGYDAFARSDTPEEYDYLHVDDNFLRLAQVIQLVPARRDYVYSQQIVFTAVRPIPRVLWPGKPLNAGFDLTEEVGMRGLSLSTSIIGEWYLSYGWIAVVLGAWFHGRLAATANQLRELSNQANPILFGLAVMVLVSGMRSMQDLVIMSYALVAWWGANRLIAKYSSQD